MKRLARDVLPAPWLVAMKRGYTRLVTRSARRAFQTASAEPISLNEDDLAELQAVYARTGGSDHLSVQSRQYGYDAHSLQQRGRSRARVLKRLLDSKLSLDSEVDRPSVLELGCADGMVSAELQRAGANSTAVDVSSHHLDQRARDEGVQFVQADVAVLPFESTRFDLVFSYNSFEHFSSPQAVFDEALRVAKVGGLIYLAFGPLYMSPYGLHAVESIKVPYCHLLFPKDMLDEYVRLNGLREIPHDSVNGWTLQQYRDVWSRHETRLGKAVYCEIPEAHGVELITQYPQCFRSKTEHFEDLIIGQIEATFCKRI